MSNLAYQRFEFPHNLKSADTARLTLLVVVHVCSPDLAGLECSSAGRSSTALSPYAAATAAAAAAAGAWTMCLTFGDA